MLTTGAWRLLATQAKDVDVDRVNQIRRDRRIRAIVWQLTEGKPRLVKVRERTFADDVGAALVRELQRIQRQ